ncbi:MAG: hypothetical protein CMJ81_04450 [Planctomycetaceae bacterium]|nr:hypothetical protein [Planctomycetaceae bacterium]
MPLAQDVQMHHKVIVLLGLVLVGGALVASVKSQGAPPHLLNGVLGVDDNSGQTSSGSSQGSTALKFGSNSFLGAKPASGLGSRQTGTRRKVTLQERLKTIRRSIMERTTDNGKEDKSSQRNRVQDDQGRLSQDSFSQSNESQTANRGGSQRNSNPNQGVDLERWPSSRGSSPDVRSPGGSTTTSPTASSGAETLSQKVSGGSNRTESGRNEEARSFQARPLRRTKTSRATAIDEVLKAGTDRKVAEEKPSGSSALTNSGDSSPGSERAGTRPGLSEQLVTKLTGFEKREAVDALTTSQGATLRVTTTGPRTIVIGKSSPYVVKVENGNKTAAEGIVVEIMVPTKAEIVTSQVTSGRARLETDGEETRRVRWLIEHLEGNSEEQLDLKLIPRDSRPFDLEVNWSFEPQVSVAQIEVQEPKIEMLLTGPSDVLFGESKVYTITVRNPGTGEAENVVLNLLPINRQDTARVRKIGNLKAGQTERIDVELTAQSPGQILVRAQAFADGGLRAEVSEEIHVRRANLELALEAPEVKYAGTVAQYGLRVSNTGDAIAENVVATVMLPSGAELVNQKGEFEYDDSKGRVSWPLGELRAGAERVLKLRCVLGTPGANRLEVVAEAADNLASFQSAVTVVEALADLKLMVDDPQGPIPVGEDAIYEIRLMNRGSKPAVAIQVYAFFSEGIEPVVVEGGEATFEPGQVVFEPITQIGAGEQLVFKIRARAQQSGNHIFRTEVTCEEPETDLAAQETTRFYGEAPDPEENAKRVDGGSGPRR